MEGMALILIVGYLFGSIIGILLVLAPLFIWIHVSKLRKEMRDGRNALLQKLSVLSDEAHLANVKLEEMQQRYLKTMQYVCDRLADVCDSLGGTNTSA